MAEPPDAEKKEEKKPIGSLENLVSEGNEFAGKAFNVGLGLGASAGATALLGAQPGASISDVVNRGRDGIVGPLSFTAGEGWVQGRDFSTKHFRDEMISGAIQTAAVIYPAYKYMNMAQQAIVNSVSATSFSQYANAAGIIGRSILNVPVYFPLAILGYYAIDHLVKKKTFRGLYSETIKPNFKKDLKNSYLYLGLPVLLNALFMPAVFQVPGAALLTFIYKIMMSGKQKKEKAHKEEGQGYLMSGSNAIGKGLRNILYASGSVLDGIADYASSLKKSAPKTPPIPQPAPAGGHP